MGTRGWESHWIVPCARCRAPLGQRDRHLTLGEGKSGLLVVGGTNRRTSHGHSWSASIEQGLCPLEPEP